MAEFLLERGADVNAQDKGGLIPLHNASSYGHLDIAALLIKYNTVVNATDKWGFTPLHEAAQKGRTQLCALLLAHGADPFLKNQEGQTPVDLASADDVRCLLQDAMASQQIVPSVPSGNMVNSAGGNSINSRPPSIVSGKYNFRYTHMIYSLLLYIFHFFFFFRSSCYTATAPYSRNSHYAIWRSHDFMRAIGSPDIMSESNATERAMF